MRGLSAQASRRAWLTLPQVFIQVGVRSGGWMCPVRAVIAAGAGAEPSTLRSARSRRGLPVVANSDGIFHPIWKCAERHYSRPASFGARLRRTAFA